MYQSSLNAASIYLTHFWIVLQRYTQINPSINVASAPPCLCASSPFVKLELGQTWILPPPITNKTKQTKLNQ